MGVEAKAEPSTGTSALDVRERGAEATTHASASSAAGGCGGEGGIRTRGAFAHRFSRAAPSTTRTPLRGRGYQREPGRPADGSGQAVGEVAKRASASSRR